MLKFPHKNRKIDNSDCCQFQFPSLFYFLIFVRILKAFFLQQKCTPDAYVHIYVTTTKGRQPASSELVTRKWEAFLRLRRLTAETAGFKVTFEPEFVLDDVKQYDKMITYAAEKDNHKCLIAAINSYLASGGK